MGKLVSIRVILSAISLFLVACVLISSISVSMVHAVTCTPDPDVGLCVVTDRTTYSPGQDVIVTVNALVRSYGYTTTFGVDIVPAGQTGYHAVADSQVGYENYLEGVPVILRLPANASGAYNVEVYYFYPTSVIAATTITVLPGKSIPEFPNPVMLLGVALLSGYVGCVTRRKKVEAPQ